MLFKSQAFDADADRKCHTFEITFAQKTLFDNTDIHESDVFSVQYVIACGTMALPKTKKLCYRKDDRAMCAIQVAVAEIWPFQIIQDGGGRHLEFVRIENSAIRSAVSETTTL